MAMPSFDLIVTGYFSFGGHKMCNHQADHWRQISRKLWAIKIILVYDSSFVYTVLPTVCFIFSDKGNFAKFQYHHSFLLGSIHFKVSCLSQNVSCIKQHGGMMRAWTLAANNPAMCVPVLFTAGPVEFCISSKFSAWKSLRECLTFSEWDRFLLLQIV